MVKKYSDATMDMIWEDITVEKKTLKKIAIELDTTPTVVYKIYVAACKRMREIELKNRNRDKYYTRKFERAAAIYSNKQFNTNE